MKFKKLILFGLFAIAASQPVTSKAFDLSIPAQSFFGIGALTEFFRDHFLFTPYALVSVFAYLGHKNRNNTLADRKQKLLNALYEELDIQNQWRLVYIPQDMSNLALWCCYQYIMPDFALRKLVNEFYVTKAQLIANRNGGQQPARTLDKIYNEIQSRLLGHS